jgi:hypothetical protein
MLFDNISNVLTFCDIFFGKIKFLLNDIDFGS